MFARQPILDVPPPQKLLPHYIEEEHRQPGQKIQFLRPAKGFHLHEPGGGGQHTCPEPFLGQEEPAEDDPGGNKGQQQPGDGISPIPGIEGPQVKGRKQLPGAGVALAFGQGQGAEKQGDEQEVSGDEPVQGRVEGNVGL